MPDFFPATPRAPRAARVGAVAISAVAIVLASFTTITSRAWIGHLFPGFMLLDNQVVASVGFGHWSGASVPGLYQSEVVAIEGDRVRSAAQVYHAVERLPEGTAVHYRLRRGGSEREIIIPTQRFGARDWLLLFGAFLLNGVCYLASGVVVWLLRPRAPLGRALLVLGAAWAGFLLTAMDLYGPATFFRLHVACETLVPPAVLQFAFLFPQPHRWARWRFAGYLPSLAILMLYERFLYWPAAYSTMLYTNMTYLGLVTFFFGTRLVYGYLRGDSALGRQRVRIVTLGTLCGFTLPGAVVLTSVATGGGYAMNLGALTQFLFSLSLAYAVVKHDLFEIDAMVKRGVYYLTLTFAVGAAYIGAVALFNQILKTGFVTDSAAFPLIFTLAVLFFFNPLRTRVQAFVDRVFFRTTYDAPRVLADAGQALASTLKRDQIRQFVRDCVVSAIPNTCTRLFVADPDGRLGEVAGHMDVPPAVASNLAEGRLLTAFDPPESYPDARTHETVRAGLAALEAEIAVPLRFRQVLVGVLTAGSKRSRLFYTAGDAEFLRALAHQTAIALQNAESYEALVELNARLEQRVRQRAAQLEQANRELRQAYSELKTTEVQLVQSEKMASLGRLVAGVAHEINNPVSFIASSVTPLKRRLERAAQVAPANVGKLIAEAEEIVGVMARGAERTTAIVKDLRSFSRLGEGTRKSVDLHEALDMGLRLLEPRWRDRITIHRNYGTLPIVECDSGQLNQVFINILANACDAITGHGNIWVTTQSDGNTVIVTIRDDGAGMRPEVVSRVFEPFFTTKDVGRGTGLGLAISHGVVADHKGSIQVESALGSGSTFRIVVPVSSAVETAITLGGIAGGTR